MNPSTNFRNQLGRNIANCIIIFCSKLKMASICFLKLIFGYLKYLFLRSCAMGIVCFNCNIFFTFAFLASCNTNRSQENITFQARKSINVCLGDSRSTVVAENLWSKYNTICQQCKSYFEKRRFMVRWHFNCKQ